MTRKIGLALCLALIGMRLLPLLVQNYTLATIWRSWQSYTVEDRCAALTPGAEPPMTFDQRVVVGSMARTVGCLDLAAAVLPEFDADYGRSPLVAYQWGMIAWAQSDPAQATLMWRKVPDIEQRLLAQARQLRENDSGYALLWYEAAVMSANSLAAQADALAAYTAEARGSIEPTLFRERLERLAAFFGDDSAPGYRLRGQRSFLGGDYQTAVAELRQAIVLGRNDAETWYLLGEALWNANDLADAEEAYRQALASPVQIAWRRPWHLDRLSALLVKVERPFEALPFQQEAVSLDSDYYYYADNLAVLYRLLGDESQAQAFCQQARQNMSAAQQTALRCEQP